MLETAQPSASEADRVARRLRHEIAEVRSQLDARERLPAYEEAPELYERLDDLVVAHLRLQLQEDDRVSTQ